MHKDLQVGLIGFGIAGQYFHAPLISTTPGLRLASIVQRHDTSATTSTRRNYPDAAVVRDAQTIINDKSIDLVVLATPNASHFELAELALRAGKHVVVDKPFTVTSIEARQLITTAQAHERVLSVFHNRRWDADFLTVQHVLEAGLLGRVVEYEARFDRYRPLAKPGAWREQDVPGAGILYDLGAHLIDQALVLFGRPERVRAVLRRQRGGVHAPDYFEVALDYAELTAHLKTSMLVRDPGTQIAIHGTRGSFLKQRCDPQENDLRTGRSPLAADWGCEAQEQWGKLNTEIEGLRFEGDIESLPGSYPSYYLNVHDAIRYQAPLAVTAGQARDVVRVIELAMESHETGRAVAIDPATDFLPLSLKT